MPQRGRLTHIDARGAARMVDVGTKPVTEREAVAECRVRMSAGTLRAVRDSQVAKGDTLAVARVAGIMGAKRTPDLIPLCHPLPISGVDVDFELEADGIRITARARVSGQTGVEMEALTAAAVAGLTVIDMVKGMEKGVWIEGLKLLRKSGGKSGDWQRPSS